MEKYTIKHTCIVFVCYNEMYTLFRVPDWCPRLLINREKAGVKSPLLRLWGMMSEGLQLDGDSVRDVARLGDCDDGCLELADKLGWGVSHVYLE